MNNHQNANKYKFKISTFVSSVESIPKIVEAGAERLIIEDKKYSLLYRDDANVYSDNVDYNKIDKLVSNIKNLDNNIDIVFNIDKIFHNDDLSELECLLDFLIEKKINTFRIMDLGVARKILLKYPFAKIFLNTETGNNNYQSILFMKEKFGNSFDGIVLSKELDFESIKNIMSKVSVKTELQVHGYIMLLYTRRRVLRNLNLHNENNNFIKVYLEEGKRKNEFLSLIDNIHGSYLLHSQLICLIKELPEIYELGINNILIDLRGESFDVLYNTVKTYRKATDVVMNGVDGDLSDLEKLLPGIGMKFIKGFFLGNSTDKNSGKNINLPNLSGYRERININFIFVGKVCDVIKSVNKRDFHKNIETKNVKEAYIAVDIMNKNIKIHLKNNIFIYTPEGKIISINICTIKDLYQNNLNSTQDRGLYIFNGAKGVTVNSEVFTENRF